MDLRWIENSKDPRERENRMMGLLAAIVEGRYFPVGDEEEAELRQLGYCAALARGRVEDPHDRLAAVVKFCRKRVENIPAPDQEYRDYFQARWGARWHLDAQKLKEELHLHLR